MIGKVKGSKIHIAPPQILHIGEISPHRALTSHILYVESNGGKVNGVLTRNTSVKSLTCEPEGVKTVTPLSEVSESAFFIYKRIENAASKHYLWNNPIQVERDIFG